MFTTAGEYLIDYAKSGKCDEWIAKVIDAFMQKDAETHIIELAEDFLDISEYSIMNKEDKTINTLTERVYLKELIHNSGVNALASHQKIRFTPEVNIIYGLNGTGKSSYFRILNEMIGGENSTPIRSNIYKDVADDISVDAKYSIEGGEKFVSWNGKSRGLVELKSLRVFDSAYTNNLLKKRNSDDLVVKPYGLYVFADILTYIDQIINKINELVIQKTNHAPSISEEGLSEEIINILRKEEYIESDEIVIKSIIAEKAITEHMIKEKENELSNLRIGDPKDKITILKLEKEHVEKTKQWLMNNAAYANSYIKDVINNIRLFHELKQESEKSRERLEVLREIPGSDTKQWKEFISKGIEYRNKHNIEVCPFCQQKYSQHASEIVNAYALFLDNRSQVDFESCEKTLEVLYKNIDKWNTTYELEELKCEQKLKFEIESVLTKIIDIRKALLKSIENKTLIEGVCFDIEELCREMGLYSKSLEEKIALFNEISEGKNDVIKQAEIELIAMKNKHAVQTQRVAIDKLMELKKWSTDKNRQINELSSQKQKISSLSKKAHNELLTEQLQNVFSDNLKKLNIRNIDIELQGKNSKGIQQTELFIRNNKDVTTILSEGEQKATALALFLAEIFLSQNKSTIVFDDPVNSLDHRMMQALADLLMNVENQIIIFTHNKMFLDCFECTEYGHICKGLNSACSRNKGKHIFLYETNSEGQNRKGVIVEKRVQNLQYYLEELEAILKETPFTKYDEAGIKLRRGVETAIDEIVFNRQVPTKLSNKNSRINWDELKKISNDGELIDGLKHIHGRASGGELHNGSERENNPIDRDEIVQLYEKLKELCHK